MDLLGPKIYELWVKKTQEIYIRVKSRGIAFPLQNHFIFFNPSKLTYTHFEITMVTTDDITSLANKASAATWPFCGIASVFFFMRLFSAHQQKNEAPTWEDLVLTISWMFEICQAAFFQKELNEAKSIDLTRAPQTLPSAIFWAVLANNWSFLSIEIPKIGVALMVTRLFRSGRWAKTAIWMLTITINVMAVAAFIMGWLMCDPAAALWNPWEHPDAKCWSRDIQVKYTLVLGGLSSLFNIALTVYPATIIWGLNMPRWKKVSTILLLGLGVV